MKRITKFYMQIHLALSKIGLKFILGRIPSMLFWSAISTGLLISGQFLYFNLLPADYFFKYDSPARVSNVELGQKPVLDYCRVSNGDYPVIINAQIKKVEPPVFVQSYKVISNIPEGKGCVSREITQQPTVPGSYKIYYTAEVTLPFGIKKFSKFETTAFTVATPNNIYGSYKLTVLDSNGGSTKKAIYSEGAQLQYAFTGILPVETFGTTERHLVCGSDDLFIDSFSGRDTPGEKDSINRTVNIPSNLQGECILELRLTVTVKGSTESITQTLKSNSFVVQ